MRGLTSVYFLPGLAWLAASLAGILYPMIIIDTSDHFDYK